MSKPIESLPNIGPELAASLRFAGVNSAEDLIALGATAVWRRLVRAGILADIQSLYLLDGAASGVRWDEMPFERKQELRQFAVSYSQGV
ncbi:MAG: TfoX/Sxy family DNA transformation protein [Verrucomicrobia bacterium]|nr:TfoX/Sxy family DNA transformation protein [Verrucomicrobiota bacterium]